jgi:hypothetical protein
MSKSLKGVAVSNSEVILYTSHDGRICLKLKMLENTVWLTQSEIAELFGKGRSTIAEHISAIFKDGELEFVGISDKLPMMESFMT